MIGGFKHVALRAFSAALQESEVSSSIVSRNARQYIIERWKKKERPIHWAPRFVPSNGTDRSLAKEQAAAPLWLTTANMMNEVARCFLP
jgi:hypothetical protein